MIRSGLFHGDGQPFNADRLARELKEGMMKAATGCIERAVIEVVCPEPEGRATVTRTATGWEIHGCCEALMADARQKLESSLKGNN